MYLLRPSLNHTSPRPHCLFTTSVFTFLPNAEGDLQQSANTRDEEYGADEVALCEGVVLQTQPLRQDQRDGEDASERSQAVLRGQRRVNTLLTCTRIHEGKHLNITIHVNVKKTSCGSCHVTPLCCCIRDSTGS